MARLLGQDTSLPLPMSSWGWFELTQLAHWHGCPAHISICHSTSTHVLHSLLQEDETCPVPGDVPLLLAGAALAPGILQICMGQGCRGQDMIPA